MKLHVLLLTLAVAGLVAILSPLVYGAYLRANVTRVKAELRSDLPLLQVPAGCREQTRTYQSPGIDDPASWSVSYACDEAGGVAYEDISHSVRARGGVALRDFDFRLPSGDTASYYFFPQPDPARFPLDTVREIDLLVHK